MRMKKNLITITKHPSTSCFVEEGSKAGTLRRNFIRPLLLGGGNAKKITAISYDSFYVNFYDKRREEQDLWRMRVRVMREFARACMV